MRTPPRPHPLLNHRAAAPAHRGSESSQTRKGHSRVGHGAGYSAVLSAHCCMLPPCHRRLRCEALPFAMQAPADRSHHASEVSSACPWLPRREWGAHWACSHLTWLVCTAATGCDRLPALSVCRSGALRSMPGVAGQKERRWTPAVPRVPPPSLPCSSSRSRPVRSLLASLGVRPSGGLHRSADTRRACGRRHAAPSRLDWTRHRARAALRRARCDAMGTSVAGDSLARGRRAEWSTSLHLGRPRSRHHAALRCARQRDSSRHRA